MPAHAADHPCMPPTKLLTLCLMSHLCQAQQYTSTWAKSCQQCPFTKTITQFVISQILHDLNPECNCIIPFQVPEAKSAAAAFVLLVEDPVYHCFSIPAAGCTCLSSMPQCWFECAVTVFQTVTSWVPNTLATEACCTIQAGHAPPSHNKQGTGFA